MKTVFLVLVSTIILSACGDTDAEDGANHEAPSEDDMRTLDVDLSVPSETVEAGDSVKFSAHVTSNEEDVEEADQVMFEVLSDEEESLDMIEAEHDDSGNYVVDYTFDSPGEYTVISHVDAFDLHTMPQEDVVVE